MYMVMGVTVDFVTEATFEDVTIRKMASDTGLVYGFAAWFESDITVKDKMRVEELVAGYSLSNDQFTYLSRPNKAAETCAIRLYEDEMYPLSMTWDKDLEIHQNCMQSAVGCLGKNVQTMHRSLERDDSSCEYSLVYDKKPRDIDEAVVARTAVSPPSTSMAKIVKMALFGKNKTVNLTSVLVLAGFVVVVLLLKMKFLWWPTKAAKSVSSSSDMTPLMKEECQVYQ